MRTVHYFITIGLAVLFTAPSAFAQDANGNGISDSLELRNGAADCNHNGVPDNADSDRPHFSAAVEHLNALEQFMSDVLDTCPIDMNADGKPDIVTTSMPDPNLGYVTFWRNVGGPGLTYIGRLTMNNARPHYIRSADMNADGRPDLVIADDSFTRVYVFMATGTETFASPITLQGTASNNGFAGLAIGDLDNDGDIDIAASAWGLNAINVWRSNGNGTFGSVSLYPVGFAPRGLAIGDFTGDGLADIAVANSFESGAPPSSDGTVTLLRNQGSTFVFHATLTMPTNTGPFGIMHPQPQDLGLSDVNHDGNLDLIVSSKQSQRLDLWTNNGAGTFSLIGAIGAGYYIGSEASRVLCRDLDNDGWDDVAWCDARSYSVGVYKNQSGTFEFRQSLGAGNFGSISVEAADFDNDGLPDLAVSNDGLRTFSILRNKGNLMFDSAYCVRPTQYPGGALLADFTGDGITDFAASEQGQTGTIAFNVHPGRGDGTFLAPITTATVPESGSYIARDVNHDNKLDLIVVLGQCRVMLGNGDGTFQPEIVNPASVLTRNVITDVNQDGNLDFVWIFPGHPGTLYRSFGDGAGHFQAGVAVGVVPAEDQSIGFGDLDGDGAPEIFSGHAQGLTPTGGIFSVYPNNGDGTFAARQDRFITGQPVGPAVIAIASADFDGDGDIDIVVSAGGLKLYRNVKGVLPQTPETLTGQGASILTVADINLDGVPDLYGRATRGIAFLNNGNAFFDKIMFMHLYDSNARGMVIGDINNDGRQDMLIEPENSWSKYVYLNLPPNSQDCDANGTPDECQADTDGDGIPDVCDPPGVPGDVNGDGIVNAADLLAVINAWGACTGCAADLNADGMVNVGDLLIVINHWG